MEYATYQRPREKIRLQGIYALSEVELLQVLVGSGSGIRSAALIAHDIQQMLGSSGSSEVLYDTLLTIAGIGHAKACVVLAALELGRRYTIKASSGVP